MIDKIGENYQFQHKIVIYENRIKDTFYNCKIQYLKESIQMCWMIFKKRLHTEDKICSLYIHLYEIYISCIM